MAALTATTTTLAGVAPSPASVAASDTIAEAQFGSAGVILRVINGGASSDTVTITDPTTTALGSAATNPTVAVANGAAKMILIPRTAINPSTGVATVAHSYTTSVTCEVWKV
jgi:Ca2+-binding RTX toxin-like protein